MIPEKPGKKRINNKRGKQMKTVPINQQTIKTIGRTFPLEDALWLALSGTGVAFTFTGSKLQLTVLGSDAAITPDNYENYTRIAVYVNDKRVVDDTLQSREKTYKISDSTERIQNATIHIVKLSECAMSVIGLKELTCDDASVITPLPAKERKIEIIGDSITCGYGIDDENCEHHFSTATEDVTRAYAYKTAKALDADYSLFSISGYGIISGYTDNPEIPHEDQKLPDFYESVGFSYDTFPGKLIPHKQPWDFDKFVPDIIVINLGTNDDSYCQDDCEKQAKYTASYEAFIKTVRRNNPTAVLLCVLGLMGARLYPCIVKACESYTKATGDTNIHTLQLPEQDGNVGYVADYHPLEVFHDAAKEVLADKICEIMEW